MINTGKLEELHEEAASMLSKTAKKESGQSQLLSNFNNFLYNSILDNAIISNRIRRSIEQSEDFYAAQAANKDSILNQFLLEHYIRPIIDELNELDKAQQSQNRKIRLVTPASITRQADTLVGYIENYINAIKEKAEKIELSKIQKSQLKGAIAKLEYAMDDAFNINLESCYDNLENAEEIINYEMHAGQTFFHEICEHFYPIRQEASRLVNEQAKLEQASQARG